MQNDEIRAAAKAKGVLLWQVAERLGINDGNLSRKLRRELPPQEREMILEIIDEIAGGGENNADDASTMPG